MGAETLADQIQRIRKRLEDIKKERAALPDDAFGPKGDLLDEEHTLQARLGELQDEAAEEGVGIAQKQAGEAANPDRIPDTPAEV